MSNELDPAKWFREPCDRRFAIECLDQAPAIVNLQSPGDKTKTTLPGSACEYPVVLEGEHQFL